MRESDEAAKRLLEQARSRDEVKAAIQSALQMGMPLAAIEQYLDALDLLRAQSSPATTRQLDPPAATNE